MIYTLPFKCLGSIQVITLTKTAFIYINMILADALSKEIQ